MAGSENARQHWLASALAAVAVIIAVIALVIALTNDSTSSSSTSTGPVSRPWTGFASGTRQVVSATTATIDGTFSGTTGTGKFHSLVTLHGANFTGMSTMTDTSGNVIRAAIAGWDVPENSTTELAMFTFKIQSGSGRFASATGSTTDVATTVTSGASSQVSITFSGSISY
jgi:hypothetical protein